MKVGIIGAAGSGKTTLFNALTGQTAQTGGSGRKTHLGVVKVPDERLDAIQKMTGRKNRVNAEITFSDVAGEFAGKPAREHGLDPEVANMMKALDALAIVIGDFPGYSLPNGGKADSLASASEIESDLMLADLMIVENKLDRIKREPVPEMDRQAIEKCKAFLDQERPLRLLELNATEEHLLSSFTFLSREPALFIQNIGEEDIGKPDNTALESFAAQRGAPLLAVCAKVEMEIAQMPEADRAEFRTAMGIGESALDRFIRESYKALSLISFFTAIPGAADEARAWTIKNGSTALEAAGKVHSDIRRGFIRAEVVSYGDFVDAGGLDAAKGRGKIRLEGKEYIVRDGDIINFRFNI